METLAIIVPCYNEQEALPLFYKEASKVLEKLNYDYKLLLINDGSKDNTLSIMKSIAEKDEHVKYLSFSRNFGKEAAMYAGFCNANADYVCVMDADMQDPPSLLPEMLEILHTQDYDSVATRRKNREGEPPIRSWFAHRLYEIINKISDADIVDGARDFGVLMTIVSFLMLVVVVGRKLIYGDPVAGWASTICVIIFIGGLQLFCLGVIGHYIAKMYLETKQRPHFIISETNDEDAVKLK